MKFLNEVLHIVGIRNGAKEISRLTMKISLTNGEEGSPMGSPFNCLAYLMSGSHFRINEIPYLVPWLMYLAEPFNPRKYWG